MDGVESGFALDVDQMLEVPTDDVGDGVSRGNGDVAGVIAVFGRDNFLQHVAFRQFFVLGAKSLSG
jgi:hypothetical protein